VVGRSDKIYCCNKCRWDANNRKAPPATLDSMTGQASVIDFARGRRNQIAAAADAKAFDKTRVSDLLDAVFLALGRIDSASRSQRPSDWRELHDQLANAVTRLLDTLGLDYER
jgi:hypothetical protein